MKIAAEKAAKPKFEKVADVHNLYRYNGAVYYALVRPKGKRFKRSLETTDKATAKRKLADFEGDLLIFRKAKTANTCLNQLIIRGISIQFSAVSLPKIHRQG